MQDLHVMLFIHGMNGGGSERQMSYLASECVENYRTTLVTLSKEFVSQYPIDPRVQSVALGLTSATGGALRGIVGNIRRINALRRVANKIKPNVVLSFCDTNNILAGLALGRRLPTILCERSDPQKQKLSRAWEFLRDQAYPRASSIVSQTDCTTDYFKSRYPRFANCSGENVNRLTTIPSAIRIPERNWNQVIADRQSKSTKTLIVLGRLSAEKRINFVLDAWGHLASQFTDWKLRIVGDGATRSDLQDVASVQNLPRVEWVGWTCDSWSELSSADAYCITSGYEGFPQAMLEAMACGLAVVAFDSIPAIRETISHEVNGLLVQDATAFVLQLRRVMSEPSLRQEIGENAFQRARAFTWQSIAPKWREVIQASYARFRRK